MRKFRGNAACLKGNRYGKNEKGYGKEGNEASSVGHDSCSRALRDDDYIKACLSQEKAQKDRTGRDVWRMLNKIPSYHNEQVR